MIICIWFRVFLSVSDELSSLEDLGSPVTMGSATNSLGSLQRSSVSPPTVLNGSKPPPGSPIGFGEIPPTGFGESPPTVNDTTSISTNLKPFIGCIILVTSIITGKFILDM